VIFVSGVISMLCFRGLNLMSGCVEPSRGNDARDALQDAVRESVNLISGGLSMHKAS
jgi:hypothetical protein